MADPGIVERGGAHLRPMGQMKGKARTQRHRRCRGEVWRPPTQIWHWVECNISFMGVRKVILHEAQPRAIKLSEHPYNLYCTKPSALFGILYDYCPFFISLLLFGNIYRNCYDIFSYFGKWNLILLCNIRFRGLAQQYKIYRRSCNPFSTNSNGEWTVVI